MASREERLRRAREIVEQHEIAGLGYMIDDPLAPDADTPVGRYMTVTCTDHSADRGDSWLEFVAKIDEVTRKIADLVLDEWGLIGTWDLDAEDYVEPLSVTVTVEVQLAETVAPVVRTLTA